MYTQNSTTNPPLGGLQFQQPRKYFGATEDNSAKQTSDLKKSSIFFSTPQQQQTMPAPLPPGKLEFGHARLEFKQPVSTTNNMRIPSAHEQPIRQSATNNALLLPSSAPDTLNSKPMTYSSQIVGSSTSIKPAGLGGGLATLGRMAKNVTEHDPFAPSINNKPVKEAVNPFATLDTTTKVTSPTYNIGFGNKQPQKFTMNNVSTSSSSSSNSSFGIGPASNNNNNNYSASSSSLNDYKNYNFTVTPSIPTSNNTPYSTSTNNYVNNNNYSSSSSSNAYTSSSAGFASYNSYAADQPKQYSAPKPSFTNSYQSTQNYNTYTPATTNYDFQQPTSSQPGSFAKKTVRFDSITDYNTSKKQTEYQQKLAQAKVRTNEPAQKLISKSDFVIGKSLGKGQFGEVYLVKHKKTGFVCAMKTIKKSVIKEQKVEEQILRELKIQFFLKHQNIVQLYGFFDDKQCVYLLLEICCDGQLYDVLKRERRMNEERASEVIKQVCTGIDRIHRQKIIHRDIKPQNVIMHAGVAKICDFGWAVYRGNELRTTFCGTPLYTPPEMIRGEKYDEAVDIWSIGILTYELIVGRIPFKIYSENDFDKILTDEITFPEHVDLSDCTKDFILKILKRNKQERYEIEDLLVHPFLKLHTKKAPVFDFGGFKI